MSTISRAKSGFHQLEDVLSADPESRDKFPVDIVCDCAISNLWQQGQPSSSEAMLVAAAAAAAIGALYKIISSQRFGGPHGFTLLVLLVVVEVAAAADFIHIYAYVLLVAIAFVSWELGEWPRAMDAMGILFLTFLGLCRPIYSGHAPRLL